MYKQVFDKGSKVWVRECKDDTWHKGIYDKYQKGYGHLVFVGNNHESSIWPECKLYGLSKRIK